MSLVVPAPEGRVLLLDVDGVLVTPPDWVGARLRRETPEVWDAFFTGPFPAATRGELDLRDALPPYLERAGRSESPTEFLAAWHDAEAQTDAAMVEAVRRLRGAGWPIHLATNQERHRTRHLLETVRLGDLVDGAFVSCDIGRRKPDPGYFAEVTRRLGADPARIVFFDDAPENVAGARAAGWTAHLYRDVVGFLRDLAATA